MYNALHSKIIADFNALKERAVRETVEKLFGRKLMEVDAARIIIGHHSVMVDETSRFELRLDGTSLGTFVSRFVYGVGVTPIGCEVTFHPRVVNEGRQWRELYPHLNGPFPQSVNFES